MGSDVFHDIEVRAAGCLAAESPIGMFHDGRNYTASGEPGVTVAFTSGLVYQWNAGLPANSECLN